VTAEGTAHGARRTAHQGQNTKPPPIPGRASGTVRTIYQLIVTLHLPNWRANNRLLTQVRNCTLGHFHLLQKPG